MEELNLEDFSIDEILEFIQTEEYSQLDELSKATIGKYIKKSSDDIAKKSDEVSRSRFSNPDFSYKKSQQLLKRQLGVHKATDKLTKEETDMELDEYTIDELLEFITTDEYAQLDELSKKTLSSYIKKAAPDVSNKSITASKALNKDPIDFKTYDKDVRKLKNRVHGISTATDKITKEETDMEDLQLEDFELDELIEFITTDEYAQLDEISKSTLSSYIKKASVDIAKKKDSLPNARTGNQALAINKAITKRSKNMSKASGKIHKEGTEMTKDIVENILSENLVALKENFADAMGERLYTKLEEKRLEIASSMYEAKEDDDDEKEVDDESFSKSLHGQLKKAEDIDNNPGDDDDDDDDGKVDKRKKASTGPKDEHRHIQLKSGHVKLSHGDAGHINKFLDGLKPERRSQVVDHMHKSPEHFNSIHKVVKQFSGK